jgi:hypothetical protein
VHLRLRRAIAAVCCVFFLVAGCSGGDDNDITRGNTTTAPGTSPTASAPATTSVPRSTPTVTQVFPTDELPCQRVPAPKTPVTSVAPAGAVFLTKVEEVGDECVDHVVFELTSKDAQPPGYTVTYGTPPFARPGSGEPVAVAGRAFVLVTISPGYGFDFEAGKATYTGPQRITLPGTNHVRELVQIGDYEGTLTWAIGLDSKRPFTVQATVSPRVQLAVTIG